MGYRLSSNGVYIVPRLSFCSVSGQPEAFGFRVLFFGGFPFFFSSIPGQGAFYVWCAASRVFRNTCVSLYSVVSVLLFCQCSQLNLADCRVPVLGCGFASVSQDNRLWNREFSGALDIPRCSTHRHECGLYGGDGGGGSSGKCLRMMVPCVKLCHFEIPSDKNCSSCFK